MDLRQQQEDEVEALKAIYEEAVYDCRNDDVWKVDRPPEIELTLYPCDGQSSSHAELEHTSPDDLSLKLHVKMGQLYPKDPPAFSVVHSSALTDDEVEILKNELVALADNLKGEVMCMELAENVRQYLFTKRRQQRIRLKRPGAGGSGGGGPGGLYEQMTRRQGERAADEHVTMLEAQIMLAEKEKKAITDEVQRRRRDRHLIDNATPIDIEQPPPPQTRSASVPSSKKKGGLMPEVVGKQMDEDENDHEGNVVGLVRKRAGSEKNAEIVRFGDGNKFLTLTTNNSSLGDKNANYRLISGHVTGFEPVTFGAFSEWRFGGTAKSGGGGGKCKNKLAQTELQQVLMKLETLQREWANMPKIWHQRVLPFLAFDVQKDHNGVVARILRESKPSIVPVSARISAMQKKEGEAFSERDLSLLAAHILAALQFLHSKSLVHRYISVDFIHMDDTQDDNNLLLSANYYLSDYTITKKMGDIFAEYWSSKNVVLSCPDLIEPVYAGLGKPSQRSDIFMFGLALLTLRLGGEKPSDFEPRPPSNSSPVFADFIGHCVDKVEANRWTASALLAHAFAGDAFRAPAPTRQMGRARDAPDADRARATPSDNTETKQLPLRINPGFSRLDQEFDTLQWLGSGGFGDVIKVRNRLDGNVYAMKRVPLSQQNKVLSRKITREVKLLSRLNHENVVRYYNSWIETCYVAADSSSGTASASVPKNGNVPKTEQSTVLPDSGALVKKKIDEKSMLNLKSPFDPFADPGSGVMAPPPKSTASKSGWTTTSYGEESNYLESDESDGGSSDSEMFGVFGTSFYPGERSESVIFEENPETSPSSESLEQKRDNGDPANTSKLAEMRKTEPETETESSSLDSFVQVLFIQMEYCEKSTIRQAIDLGELVANFRRAWRLFREIIEGLVYIHQQGMIHRDLKPVNVFLDSFDHVKIGDFGLATHEVSDQELPLDPSVAEQSNLSGLGVAASFSLDQGKQHTGHVGTAMYVAPELLGLGQPVKPTVGAKLAYSQKVDMYSLGIILFEMFEKPLGTGMERYKILTDLRSEQVKVPEDFASNPELLTQTELIRQLLCHDPTLRPSSEELLASPYIPPVEMEDREFHNTISTVLAAKQTRKHRRLMRALFDREPDVVQRYLYDDWMYKSSFSYADTYFHNKAESKLHAVFKSFGFQRCSGPSFTPFDPSLHQVSPTSTLTSTSSTSTTDRLYNLLDVDGVVVTAPYDLRTSFARYVARRGIPALRRYDVGTVVRRAPAARETHPRQVREAAIDIVAPTIGRGGAASIGRGGAPDEDYVWAVADLLIVLAEVVNRFQGIDASRCRIRLNHLGLLKGILTYAGVERAENQVEVMCAIGEMKVHRQNRQQAIEQLLNVGVNEHQANTIMKYLDLEEEVSKVTSVLRSITARRSTLAADLTKQALKECDLLVGYLKALSYPFPVSLAPGFVYNVQHYAPHMIFQLAIPPLLQHSVVGRSKKGGGNVLDILAIGGRYDKLIERFEKPLLAQREFGRWAVGASIAVDCLVAATKIEAAASDSAVISPWSVDVVICSIAGKHGSLMKEKISVWRSLVAAKVSTYYEPAPVEDLTGFKDACRKAGTKILVILKEETQCRVRKFNPDRLIEKEKEISLPLDELCQNVQHELQSADASEAFSSGGRSHSSHSFSESASQNFFSTHSQFYSTPSTASTYANLDIQFVSSEKLAFNTKKRFEQQIGATLSSKLMSKETIHVLAVEFPAEVVKHMAAYADLSSESNLRASFVGTFQAFGKYKKLIKNVVEIIVDFRFEAKRSCLIVLYSYVDDVYRVLI